MPPHTRASSMAASRSSASHLATAFATDSGLSSQPSSFCIRACRFGRPKCGSTQRPSFVGHGWVIAIIASWFLLTTGLNAPSAPGRCR